MRFKQILKNPVLHLWLPLAFVTTLTFGLLFTVLRQHMRQEAEYPQIQLAQDVATDLYKNQSPSVSLVASVDLEKSLAPFVVLYDSNGKAVDGTGKLNGALAQIPPEILEYVRKHTEQRVTWQASKTAQISTVIRYYQNPQHAGFVLAGRNMRELERQENNLLLLSAVAWAIALAGSLALMIVLHSTRKKPQ